MTRAQRVMTSAQRTLRRTCAGHFLSRWRQKKRANAVVSHSLNGAPFAYMVSTAWRMAYVPLHSSDRIDVMLSLILPSALLLLRLSDGAGAFTPTLANGFVQKRSKSSLFLATPRISLECPPSTSSSSTSRSTENSGIKPLSDDLFTELQSQNPNEDAPVYDYHTQGHLQALRPLDSTPTNPPLAIQHDHFETQSLDDLFPSLHFSNMFDSSALFRKELRNAIRHDMVFDDCSSIYGQNDTINNDTKNLPNNHH